MFSRIQDITTGILLASYLFVGAVAHLESIGELFAFGSKPEKVERQRPGRPTPNRVYWTQHKHLPPFTKVVSFSPATIAPCQPSRLERFSPLFVPENTEAFACSFRAHTFSRAPPLPTTTS